MRDAMMPRKTSHADDFHSSFFSSVCHFLHLLVHFIRVKAKDKRALYRGYDKKKKKITIHANECKRPDFFLILFFIEPVVMVQLLFDFYFCVFLKQNFKSQTM